MFLRVSNVPPFHGGRQEAGACLSRIWKGWLATCFGELGYELELRREEDMAWQCRTQAYETRGMLELGR